jgi:4-hydroxy-tetrahydrodipicolinate synthase
VALDPLIRLLFAEPNPAPLKALVAQLGECRDSVRAPFTPASEALRAKLWDAHQSLAAGLESLTQ